MKSCSLEKFNSHWLPYPACSGPYRNWLIDNGSLTRRLQACSKDFSVCRVRQVLAHPLPDEAAMLGLPRGTAAWIREVWLQDGAVPLVFARSILPRTSLCGAWRKLRHIGGQPLGAALFADACVIRGPLAYRKLGLFHPMLKGSPVKALWARRSVFIRDGRKILVTEAFLPEVLNRIHDAGTAKKQA